MGSGLGCQCATNQPTSPTAETNQARMADHNDGKWIADATKLDAAEVPPSSEPNGNSETVAEPISEPQQSAQQPNPAPESEEPSKKRESVAEPQNSPQEPNLVNHLESDAELVAADSALEIKALQNEVKQGKLGADNSKIVHSPSVMASPIGGRNQLPPVRLPGSPDASSLGAPPEYKPREADITEAVGAEQAAIRNLYGDDDFHKHAEQAARTSAAAPVSTEEELAAWAAANPSLAGNTTNHAAAAGEQQPQQSPKTEKPKEPDWDHDDEEGSIVQMSKKALQRCLEAEAAPGWESVKSPKGAEAYTVQVFERSKTLIVVRVDCEMIATKDAVLKMLKQGQGGPKNTTSKLLRVVSSSTDLLHIEVKLPIIKNRDFVACQWISEHEQDQEGENTLQCWTHRCTQSILWTAASTTVVVRVSVPNEPASSIYAPNKKCVRGRIVLQCTFVSSHPEDPNKCVVKWISCVDPAGKISGAKKMTANEGAKAMQALHKAAADSLMVKTAGF